MSGTLHLAQAQSNRGRRGRKKDFPDAERLVKRFVAQELILSLVPDVEQRLWRTVMRRKHQLTRNRVRLLRSRITSGANRNHPRVRERFREFSGPATRKMQPATNSNHSLCQIRFRKNRGAFPRDQILHFIIPLGFRTIARLGEV